MISLLSLKVNLSSYDQLTINLQSTYNHLTINLQSSHDQNYKISSLTQNNWPNMLQIRQTQLVIKRKKFLRGFVNGLPASVAP